MSDPTTMQLAMRAASEKERKTVAKKALFDEVRAELQRLIDAGMTPREMQRAFNAQATILGYPGNSAFLGFAVLTNDKGHIFRAPVYGPMELWLA